MQLPLGANATAEAVLYSGPQDQERLEQIAPDFPWLSTMDGLHSWLSSYLLAPFLPSLYRWKLGLGYRTFDMYC